jgi:hypothetical protein
MASITGYIIPFSPRPQRLITTLGTVTYNLRTRWSNPSNCWLLDIADVDNNLIIGGIPMITGADLLEQYRYLGFVGSLFAYSTDGPPDMVPTLIGLGITAQVAYIPDPAT